MGVGGIRCAKKTNKFKPSPGGWREGRGQMWGEGTTHEGEHEFKNRKGMGSLEEDEDER